MIIPVRYLIQPISHGVTDVTAVLYSDTNAVMGTYNLIEIGTTSVYGLNIDVTVNYCWTLVSSTSLNIRAIIRLAPSVVTLRNDISYLSQAETGTWDRVGSRLTYYDTAATVLAKFDLYDIAGHLTADPTAVAKRVRIP